MDIGFDYFLENACVYKNRKIIERQIMEFVMVYYFKIVMPLYEIKSNQ